MYTDVLKDLHDGELLGDGQYGRVYKGMIWGAPVAIKRLHHQVCAQMRFPCFTGNDYYGKFCK